jgi:hypothetical protein
VAGELVVGGIFLMSKIDPLTFSTGAHSFPFLNAYSSCVLLKQTFAFELGRKPNYNSDLEQT